MRQLKVRLKPWESRRLRELRDHAPWPRIGKRAMCLLMSASGQSAKQIARATGLSVDTITDIRHRWRQRRLRSLFDRPHTGRPSRVTAEYRRELRRALRSSPLNFGYVFTVWSIARLSTHLEQLTGLHLSQDWLRRLVHAEGYVVGRPKHTLKGKRDPEEYERTRRQLNQLKRGRYKQTPSTNCGMPMPASSSSCPTWFAAGCSKESSGR